MTFPARQPAMLSRTAEIGQEQPFDFGFLPDASETKMMSPRRVHELMTANFPPVELVTLDWVNMLEADGIIRSTFLDALISEFIRADHILIELDRRLGDLKSRGQLITYV